MAYYTSYKNSETTPYITPKAKLCPMISDPETPVECVQNSCAWWDGKYNRCAITSIAFKK